MSFYCFCGNEQVEKHGDVGPLCQKFVVDGWLAEAYRRWVQCGEENRKCCGGLSYRFGRDADPSERERGHLYFHGKYWEGTHNDTSVEYGVSFYDDHARTYYLRDFDSLADSEEYGENIAYLDPDFWDKLNAQLDKAPEAAWNAGLCSCEHCGYHYYEEPCCRSEAEEEDEENEDDTDNDETESD